MKSPRPKSVSPVEESLTHPKPDRVKGFFCFISGLLMGVANPPFSWWGCAFFGLVFLWMIITENRPYLSLKNNLFHNLFYGLSWGLGFYGLSLSWILGIHPMTWMGVPYFSSLLIALFCWIFITLWATMVVAGWAIGITLLQQIKRDISPVTKIIFAVTLWCVLEKILEHSILWWPSLALTQSPRNLILIQLGQLSGTTTITAVVLVVNLLFAEGIKNSLFFSKNLITAFSLLFVSYGIGYFYWITPLEDNPDNGLKIGVIQGNIPNDIKLSNRGFRESIEGYTRGYQVLVREGVDVVLLPETALPFYWDEFVANHGSLYEQIKVDKIPAFVGTFIRKPKSYTNSLITVDGQGNTISEYDKIKLVPLGEYVPLQSVLGKFIKRLSPLENNLLKGDKDQILETPFGKVIVGICYESAFPEHFRRQAKIGGKFIITASNNSHYLTSMPAQHHAHDVLRSIETNRWSARATNTGYSAMVSPKGETLWISKINRYQLHSERIYARDTMTPYVKYGDWLLLLMAVVCTVLILL